MSTLSELRGGAVFGDALRLARLDVNGVPLVGASNMIQTDNLVKLDFSHDTQAGPDITTVDAQGRACLVYRGRDTTKRSTITLDICDNAIEIQEMVLGGTIFTGANTRTVTDGATTSASPNLSSATAAWTSADVGATVTGTGIPSSTTILSITSATVAVMSANATATGASVSVTIADATAVQGYQPPKVGQIGCPNGVSIEVWSKRIVGDFQLGWWHWAMPRNFLSETARSVNNAAMAMSFAGWGNENPNWGNGPAHDFSHDSTGLWQVMYTPTLPSPLQDGYQTTS